SQAYDTPWSCAKGCVRRSPHGCDRSELTWLTLPASRAGTEGTRLGQATRQRCRRAMASSAPSWLRPTMPAAVVEERPLSVGEISPDCSKVRNSPYFRCLGRLL